MKQQDTPTAKQGATKSYPRLIYLIAWPVIVLIQSVLVGQSVTTAANFWEAPSYYLYVAARHLSNPNLLPQLLLCSWAYDASSALLVAMSLLC